MKKLLILLFSILISFNSYGEWTKVVEGVDGTTHYIDKEKVKEHGVYVYWWQLYDFLKPDDMGIMSYKVYNQGFCLINRYKPLSGVFYIQPMGEGSGESMENPPDIWIYVLPENTDGVMLKYVCDYLEKPMGTR